GTSRQCQAEVPEVDVAYIDADHSYEAVKDDIAVWYPRVAVGGALCGHDYCPGWPGVRKAVDELVAQHRLTLTTYRDNSWMVLKTA
ncbi:MAG: class I SAM-dependent methyltransferase, partial [Planctomycetaceae bacterium]